MSARLCRMGASRRHAKRGYTAVEVFLALTVLLISTAGVMSMQKASIQGNLDARRLDVANSIARTWLDRLATDATAWNTASGMTQTLWLNALVTAHGTFQTPTVVGAWSPAFDILGRDIPSIDTDTTTAYCTHVKVDVLSDFAVGAQITTPSPVLINVTVLVFWAKNLAGGTGVAASPLCNPGGPGDVAQVETNTPGTYHMIYATEALRRAD